MSDFTVQVSTSPNVPVVNAVLTTPTIDGKQSTPTKATALDVLAGKTLSGTGNIILSDSPAITTKLTVGGADILAADAVALAARGQASGLATLDSGGKLAQGLPSGIVLTTPVIDGVASSAAQATALASLAAAQQSGPIAPGDWFAAQQLLVNSVVPGLQGWGEKLGSAPGGAVVTFPANVSRAARNGGGVDINNEAGAAILPVGYSLVTNAKTQKWAFAAQFKCPSVPREAHASIARIYAASSANVAIGSIYDSGIHGNFAVQLYDAAVPANVDTGVAADLNWHSWLLCYDGITTIYAFIDYVLVASIVDLTRLTTAAVDFQLMSYAESMQATLAWYAYEPAL